MKNFSIFLVDDMMSLVKHFLFKKKIIKKKSPKNPHPPKLEQLHFNSLILSKVPKYHISSKLIWFH